MSKPEAPVRLQAKRTFAMERWTRIALRTVHIAAISVIFGALILDATSPHLKIAWATAGLTGFALMGDDLWRYGRTYLRRWMFWGTAFKLGCLGIAATVPSLALAAISLALITGSVVSHMPGKYRYRPVWGSW